MARANNSRLKAVCAKSYSSTSVEPSKNDTDAVLVAPTRASACSLVNSVCIVRDERPRVCALGKGIGGGDKKGDGGSFPFLRLKSSIAY